MQTPRRDRVALPDALDHLWRTRPTTEPVPDLASWFAHLETCPFGRSLDRALWGGFEADRLGYAFVSGYQAALAKLVAPVARIPSRMSLAATESGGGHPRAILTSLSEESGELRLRGVKTFATLASSAETLLVVAARSEPSDDVADRKPRLVVVRVPARTSGVIIEDRPPIPFAPEIPHAKLTLDVSVRPEDILPGDGYSAWLKPFRTIEDVHVLAATVGYTMKAARRFDFARPFAEGLGAAAAALSTVDVRAPLDPVAHLVLRGVFTSTRELFAAHESEWEKADADTRERWRRDLALLLVAEQVRQKRTDAAWAALREAPQFGDRAST